MKLLSNHIMRGCLLALFVLFTGALFAQTQVSGTLTDAESGDPLIGASVFVTGTTTGTVTDFDGKYSLSVPANAESLTFSYTGYGNQVVPLVAGQTDYSIALTSGELLEEVVVIGYGSVKQEQVTSAVTTIDSDDFQVGNINDPTALIQGKVAGLTISRPSNVNGGSTIRLRGISSFGGNSSPLIIIDGVVGANLNTVDPNDIESVNVLKDGSAAAIYGIQASAGVIIITTKRGQAGKPSFSYRGYVSAESVAAAPETADRDEYLRIVRETNDLNLANFVPTPGNPTPPPSGADVLPNVDFGGNTDWIDEVTRTGISHVHNLSYSGGNANGLTYRASVNYRDIKGIGFTNDGFTQLNGRVSINQRALNDRLSVSLDITATDRDQDLFNPAVYRYATIYNPTAPVRVAGLSPTGALNQDVINRANEDFGGFFEADFFDFFNPVAIGETGTAERQENSSLYSIRTSYDLTDDLAINVNYSRNRSTDQNRFEATRSSLFFGGANGGALRRGAANRSSNDNRNDLFEITGTYNLDLGGNDLELLAGYSWQEYNFQGFNVGGRGLPADAFGSNNLGQLADIAGGQANVFSYRDLYRVIGFFGRARMSIGSAYNITASIRRDGTSRNGPENKWDIFPAISASADLVDALSLEGPDQLKLRVGYGVTGSLPNANYGYLQTFGGQGQVPFNGAFQPTIGPTSNANPGLRFEKKGEFNAGIDFAFLDYRLTGTLDFYTRNVRDLLIAVPVSTPPFQFGTVEANLNNVDLVNTGVELSIGYQVGDNTDGGFSWEPRLNFSTFSTELEDNGDAADFAFGAGGVQIFQSSTPGSPGQNGDPISQVVIGEPFGGLYTRQLDVEATRAAGSYVFIGDENDKVLVGNGLPDFSLGFQNNFNFGDLDFSFFLRGDFGHDLANLNNDFYGQSGNAISSPLYNFVVNERFLDGVTSAPRFSDYFVEDASFLALDNVQLGYTLDLGEGTGFDNLRVYVAGQNLFYITDYSGVDPNVRFFDDPNGNGFQDFGENGLTPGIDRRNTFFRTRTFTLGAALGF